jgi:hypothetical protein
VDTERISADALLAVLQQLRGSHDLVIVDPPAIVGEVHPDPREPELARTRSSSVAKTAAAARDETPARS